MTSHLLCPFLLVKNKSLSGPREREEEYSRVGITNWGRLLGAYCVSMVASFNPFQIFILQSPWSSTKKCGKQQIVSMSLYNPKCCTTVYVYNQSSPSKPTCVTFLSAFLCVVDCHHFWLKVTKAVLFSLLWHCDND